MEYTYRDVSFKPLPEIADEQPLNMFDPIEPIPTELPAPEEEKKEEKKSAKERPKETPRRSRKREREGILCDGETELDYDCMRQSMADTSDIVVKRPIMVKKDVNWKARALWLFENPSTEGLGEDLLEITREVMKRKMRKLNEEPEKEVVEEVERAREDPMEIVNFEPVVDNMFDEEITKPVEKEKAKREKKRRERSSSRSKHDDSFDLHEEFSDIPPSEKCSMERRSWNMLQ